MSEYGNVTPVNLLTKADFEKLLGFVRMAEGESVHDTVAWNALYGGLEEKLEAIIEWF